MLEQLANILKSLQQTFDDIKKLPRIKLYQGALSMIGKDASPRDIAPDELGCAESINTIHGMVFGKEIGGSTSTTLLFKAILKDPSFTRTMSPLPGDICISPTGYSTKGVILHGHVGIVGINGIIMSNDSRTGTFEENYTIASWTRYFGDKGGYPVYFYRKINI